MRPATSKSPLSARLLHTALDAGMPLEALTSGRPLTITPAGIVHEPTCPNVRHPGRRALFGASRSAPSAIACLKCLTSRHWWNFRRDVDDIALLAAALEPPPHLLPASDAQSSLTHRAAHIQSAIGHVTGPGRPARFAGRPRSPDYAAQTCEAYSAQHTSLLHVQAQLRDELATIPGFQSTYLLVRNPTTLLNYVSLTRPGAARRAALAITLGQIAHLATDWAVVKAPWAAAATLGVAAIEAQHVTALSDEVVPAELWVTFANLARNDPHIDARTAFAVARAATRPS